MAYSHVAHDCHVGDDVTFANGVALGGHVTIGDGVNIGGLSAVQQFGRIGRGAFVGGVTGVPDDVIPYGMVWGDHARLSGLNLIGLKRRGVPRERIHALRAAFRFIFHGEGTLADRAREAGDALDARLKSPKSSPSFSPMRSGRSACRRERGRGFADEDD